MEIYAVVLKGLHKGREVKISQWCNDWFSTDTGDFDIDRKPFSPTSLAFTPEAMRIILEHKNNGSLLHEFVMHDHAKGGGMHFMGFKRWRPNPKTE